MIMSDEVFNVKFYYDAVERSITLTAADVGALEWNTSSRYQNLGTFGSEEI